VTGSETARYVALTDAPQMINRFRNSTVPRRRHWQPGRHRFQNRVRHAFLVSIWGYFAWMQKQV
jgi:hypothetical protein